MKPDRKHSTRLEALGHEMRRRIAEAAGTEERAELRDEWTRQASWLNCQGIAQRAAEIARPDPEARAHG